MKFLLPLVSAFIFQGLSSASAAILFSGGVAGNPVVVTITSDIVLPVNAASTSTSVSILLKNAYATDPSVVYVSPQTVYGAPGSIPLERDPAVGPTVNANEYNTFAGISSAYGQVGTRDFLMVFYFPSAQTFTIGDQLVLRAGSVTLGLNVPMPTNAISEIRAADDFGNYLTGAVIVPEPSAAFLALTGGALAVMRRQRPRSPLAAAGA